MLESSLSEEEKIILKILNNTKFRFFPKLNWDKIIYLSESVTIQKVKHLLLTVVLWLFTIEQMLEKGIAD